MPHIRRYKAKPNDAQLSLSLNDAGSFQQAKTAEARTRAALYANMCKAMKRALHSEFPLDGERIYNSFKANIDNMQGFFSYELSVAEGISNLAGVLGAAFAWNQTKQGHAFWVTIAHALRQYDARKNQGN